MWRDRLPKLLAAGALGAMLTAGSVTSSEALTVPVRSVQSIAGQAPVDQVYYRYHYRRYNPAGAFVAGAALGILGLATTAAVANSYPYSYGYYPAYYGGYYPAYRYAYPVGFYGYRRAYGRPYWGYRRAVWGGGPYWGYRRAYWGGGWGYRRAHFRRW